MEVLLQIIVEHCKLKRLLALININKLFNTYLTKEVFWQRRIKLLDDKQKISFYDILNRKKLFNLCKIYLYINIPSKYKIKTAIMYSNIDLVRYYIKNNIIVDKSKIMRYLSYTLNDKEHQTRTNRKIFAMLLRYFNLQHKIDLTAYLYDYIICGSLRMVKFVFEECDYRFKNNDQKYYLPDVDCIKAQHIGAYFIEKCFAQMIKNNDKKRRQRYSELLHYLLDVISEQHIKILDVSRYLID